MTDWDLNRHALRRHLKHDTLKQFLKWSTIRKTMYVGTGAEQIPSEYIALRQGGWYHWSKAVTSTGFGADGYKREYDPNLIHQAYHLKQWLDRSSRTIDQLSSVVEIGAGYGAMALICRRLGFTGRYHIEDLPELKVLQGYYLHNTVGIDSIIWRLPEACDLFIALHSLGEMPVSEREGLLSRVEADAYLFASSYEFESVDNATWFREYGESKPGYGWTQWAHPYQENCFYQVGVKLK